MCVLVREWESGVVTEWEIVCISKLETERVFVVEREWESDRDSEIVCYSIVKGDWEGVTMLVS